MKSTTKFGKSALWIVGAGIVGIAAVALATTSATAAPGKGGKGGKGEGKRGDRFAKRLDLDKKQEASFKQLRVSKMTAEAPIEAQIDIKRAEMKALWLSPNVTKAALMAKVNEIGALKLQMKAVKVDFKLGALQVLNAEQRIKFLKHSGKRGGKMGRRGHHGRRGPGAEGCGHGKRGERGAKHGGKRGGKRGGPSATL